MMWMGVLYSLIVGRLINFSDSLLHRVGYIAIRIYRQIFICIDIFNADTIRRRRRVPLLLPTHNCKICSSYVEQSVQT